MLSDVKIFCFLASYTVALALEVSRLWFRSGIRGIVMLGFVVAGWIAHTAFLYYRSRSGRSDSFAVVEQSGLAAVGGLGAGDGLLLSGLLPYYHAFRHLLFAAGVRPDYSGPLRRFDTFPPRAVQDLGPIHGVSIMLATVTVLFGFAAGLMYLGQANRLKRKRPPYRKLRLPSLEWLQTANSRTMLASMLLVGVAVASGIVLNLLKESPGTLRERSGRLGHVGDVRLASLTCHHRRVLPTHPSRPQGGLLDAGQLHLPALGSGGDVRYDARWRGAGKHGSGEERSIADLRSPIADPGFRIPDSRFQI